MAHKILRPPTLAIIQGGRAGGIDDPGRTSNTHLTKNVPSMPVATSPTVLAYIFISGGGVGFLVPSCPHCGGEHRHGPYSVATFLADQERWNGHAAHGCHA